MSADAPAPARGRSAAFDGIRGIAILLVVLSHSWTLWPFAPLRQAAPLNGLFYAGNEAVTVFLVIGGFLVTRSLLGRIDRTGRVRPGWYLLERLARVAPQLYLVLLALLIENLVAPGDPYTFTQTCKSVLAAATHTWNWYVANHPVAARSDMGALWYLSVSEQFYLALALLLAVAPRVDRRRLAWSVAVLIVVVTVWRAHAFHSEGWFRSSVRTTTRMDGLLWGMLAALTVDRLGALRPYAPRLAAVSLAALAAVVLSTARFGDAGYYGWLGVLTAVATTAFVVAMSLSTEVRGAARIVEWRPLVQLGRSSLAIYVWHYPVFWLVARHTVTWDWFPKAVLAYSVTASIVIVMHRLVDRPSSRLVAALALRQRPRRRRAVSAAAVPATG